MGCEKFTMRFPRSFWSISQSLVLFLAAADPGLLWVNMRAFEGRASHMRNRIVSKTPIMGKVDVTQIPIGTQSLFCLPSFPPSACCY